VVPCNGITKVAKYNESKTYTLTFVTCRLRNETERAMIRLRIPREDPAMRAVETSKYGLASFMQGESAYFSKRAREFLAFAYDSATNSSVYYNEAQAIYYQRQSAAYSAATRKLMGIE